MNQVTISGNTTRVLELLHNDANDMDYCYVTLAVPKEWKKDGSNTGKADFVPCKAWGKMAQSMVNKLTKGQFITIIGRLNTYRKEDDNGKVRTEVVVTVVSYEFYERKNKAAEDIGNENSGGGLPYEDDQQEGLPFDL